MTHIRKQIRDKLKTVLGATQTAGANVYSNRTAGNPFADAELPAINVISDPDHVTARAVGSQVAPHARAEQRTIGMKITAGVKVVPGSTGGTDDQLDQICLEVEQAIYADIFLGYPSAKLTIDARLMDTAFQFNEEGECPVGLAEMTWEFDTWVDNTNPTALQA